MCSQATPPMRPVLPYSSPRALLGSRRPRLVSGLVSRRGGIPEPVQEVLSLHNCHVLSSDHGSVAQGLA